MRTLLKGILLPVVLGVATAAAQLPPEVILDGYLLEVEQSIRENDYPRALAVMDRINALQEAADEPLLPSEYHYRYARIWEAAGALDKALASITRHLESAGRGADNYRDALVMMNRLQRLLDSRVAKETRERLELERVANGAAVVISDMEFVAIPPGQFTMGSANGRLQNQLPVTEVRIGRAFEIGRHEVTQWQWETVMGTNPSKFVGCERCPVEQVTWDEVQRFIFIFNTANGGRWRYRLPTEAEWEYAARAGMEHGYTTNLDTSAWCGDNSGNRTHAVGLKKPNGFGIYDMLGNVQEIVQDWHGTYPGGAVVDPVGPSWPTLSYGTANPDKVTRGGGYAVLSTVECEFAGRGWFTMEMDGGGGIRGHSLQGFRLVRLRDRVEPS